MSSRIWKSIMSNRIVWAITAVILAFFCWNYVVTELNPVTERKIFFTIEYHGVEQLYDRYRLRLSSDSPKQIRMKVSGTYGDVTRLQDNAVIIVDVSTVQSAGEKPLKYSVQYPSGSSSTPDVTTISDETYLTLTFDEIKSKPVDVLYNEAIKIREVGDDYNFDSTGVDFDPKVVTIEGPADIIDSIDHAQVSPLEETEKLTKTKQYERPVEFVLTTTTEDGEAQLLSDKDRSELTVDPETIFVTIPIESKKKVKLTVDIVYGGGATKDNTTVDIKPKTVIITGDAETLSTIDQINLGKIDLSAYDKTKIEQEFEIKYQEGAKGDATDATVNIEIEDVAIKMLTIPNTNIYAINIPNGYSCDIQTNELTITLRGRKDILDALEANSVRAIADLTGITAEGSVSVPASISVDGVENGEVGAIIKDSIKVNVVLTKESKE